MQAYVEQRERRAFAERAPRASLEAAKAAHDPDVDEAQVMREIEAELAYWLEE